MATQLSLNFPKGEGLLLENFIPHTGVIDAFNLLAELKSAFAENSFKEGKMVLVFGPAGSGKSHLVHGLFSQNPGEIPLTVLDYDVTKGEFYLGSESLSTERFIALYQELKIKPSILFVLTRGPLIRDEIDPHIYSRLVSGEICEISYPSESELLPVLKCILEGHGMRLEEKELIKIINQVPAVPECFTSICRELEAALASGDRFKPSIIKNILSKDDRE